MVLLLATFRTSGSLLLTGKTHDGFYKALQCEEELIWLTEAVGVTGDGDLDQVGGKWSYMESLLEGELTGCHAVGVRARTKAGTWV